MSGLPLEGVKVLDLTHAVAGPFATMLLADLGADVIKVEPPEGDEVRGAAPIVNGMSSIFRSFNRGKRSVAIDLRKEEGRRLVRLLAARSHVVVENYRPGVREKLGVDPESLFSVNRDLVYVSIKGFRPDSKYGDLPAYDMVVQGMSGIMMAMGLPGDPPIRVPFALFDIFSGYAAALEALAGLRSSQRPFYAEVYLFDSGVFSMSYLVQSFLDTGQEPQRLGHVHFSYSPHQAYRGSDGKWFIVAVVNDRQWAKLCSALKLRTCSDPANSTNVGRVANRDKINEELEEVFSKAPRDHWLSLLKEAGVPAAPVYTLGELFSDDYSLGLLEEVGSSRLLRFPGSLNGERPTAKSPPPQRQGQDSLEVLRELGLSYDEINRLVRDGVVKA